MRAHAHTHAQTERDSECQRQTETEKDAAENREILGEKEGQRFREGPRSDTGSGEVQVDRAPEMGVHGEIPHWLREKGEIIYRVSHVCE